MNTRLIAGLILLYLLGVVATTFAAEQKTIYENIDASSNHTILLSAVKEARLEITLSVKGTNTLFAPSDEAFKKLSQDQLSKLIEDKDSFRKILLAHFVVGKAISSDELKSMPGKELNGFQISVKDDGTRIGNAKVIAADLKKCSNGIMHTIDTVLIPK